MSAEVEPANHGTQQALELAAKGRLAEAEVVLEQLLQQQPKDFFGLVIAAQLRERRSDLGGALAFYDRAIEANPGHAFPFTRRALLLLRTSIGMPARPRPLEINRPVVTMSDLGANGRFGNQLLQYGLLRIYAAKVGAQVAAPDWLGRDLFGHDDAFLDAGLALPKLSEAQVMEAIEGTRVGIPSADLTGYFCGPVSRWAAWREVFRESFQLAGVPRAHVEAGLGEIEKRGDTLVAIHLRRGDFGYGQFWIAPEAWYLDWLRALWPALKRPILYVATDDAATLRSFADYRPIVASDVSNPLPGAEFLMDHAALCAASYLAISNSTFSLSAALLNRTPNLQCFRPEKERGLLRGFDPWVESALI